MKKETTCSIMMSFQKVAKVKNDPDSGVFRENTEVYKNNI